MNSSTSVFHFFTIFFCLVQIFHLCHGAAQCIKTEREALLAFKARVNDPSGSLASWTGKDCCKWSGVQCNYQGQVQNINLSNKSLSGELLLGEFKNLESFDLSRNGFTGSLPENFGQLMPKMVKFFISWNDITGKIPSSMCDMEELQILSLRSNRISGELPDCWSHWMFWAIDVSNNNLTGKIPKSFGLLPSLSVVMLGYNNLDGEIPSSLQNCSGLTNIDLQGNKFSGSLPSWIGEKLASLFMLNLGSNFFSGTIPQQFCIPANLHILDLSYNKLSGEIPKCIGNLTGFVNGNNTQAYEDLLYMATKGRNPEYGNYIAKVNSINLSYNKFSGGIPEGLGKLNSLSQLNLSYNNLAGRIPTQLKFKDPSVYEGNPALCGPPLQKKCTGRHGKLKNANKVPQPRHSPGSKALPLTIRIINLCHGAKCINTERQALLAFKAGLTDPSGRLASWIGDECCKWSGVQCKNQTGDHITMLHLRNLFGATGGDLTAYQKSCLGGNGNISSSLLKFQHLDYLDLSFNDFQGVAIPEFINAYGNSGTYKLHAEKLDWLSGLLDLKILNLGYVKLSSVGKNWLHTLNKLPSLVELRLEFCELRNIPLSLPSISFNLLSVLDLSQNSFNSIIPEWLYLDGEIPGIFGKLPKLKVLDLSANNFNGEIHDFLSGFSGYVNNELVFLDLNANLLVGELPESLGVRVKEFAVSRPVYEFFYWVNSI
ncbi:hypothetical protein ACFE04_001440 [Oxalis oulophora]